MFDSSGSDNFLIFVLCVEIETINCCNSESEIREVF